MIRSSLAIFFCVSTAFAQTETAPSQVQSTPVEATLPSAVPPILPPPSSSALLEPRSADTGSFGFRVTLLGGGLPLYSPVPGAADNAPVPPGAIGVMHVCSSKWALMGDLGFTSVRTGGNAKIGFLVGFGADYRFRTAADALRPLLNFQINLVRGAPNNPSNDGQDLPSLMGQVGGGAEYFFSKNFSLAARMGLGVGVRFGLGATAPGGGISVIGTVNPSVSAAWYL
jgi:hypothetical protein